MVTSDRRHAGMLPVGPDHSTPAAMSSVQPWTTNTPRSVIPPDPLLNHWE